MKYQACWGFLYFTYKQPSYTAIDSESLR